MTSDDLEIIKFINAQRVDLICAKPECESYSEYIEDKLAQYIKGLADLNTILISINILKVINDVSKLSSIIIDVIQKYENGDVYTSIQAFTEDLMLDPIVFNIVRESKKTLDINQNFYRATTDKSNDNLAQDRMFHIPFSMRRKIKNYRFSINGYPCLYISNCSYLCWEEMNRPKLDELSVSKFKYIGPKKKFTVISLDSSIFLESNMKKNLSGKHKRVVMAELEDLIIKLPLFFILLNKVKEKEEHFKPEYIFPQMFTNFIKNALVPRDACGIEYPSTKIRDDSFSLFNYSFFTLPTPKTKSGYCKHLKNRFIFTQGFPLMYSVLSPQKLKYKPFYVNALINVGKGISAKYNTTIFYKHECMLEGVPPTKLK